MEGGLGILLGAVEGQGDAGLERGRGERGGGGDILSGEESWGGGEEGGGGDVGGAGGDVGGRGDEEEKWA